MFHQGKNICDHFLFEGLDASEKKFLESNLENGTAFPNEYLYKDDNRLKYIYFIYKGTTLVGKNLRKPNEMVLQLKMQPLFLGVESLLLNQGNHQFAKTLSKVYYSKISNKVFYSLVSRNAVFHDTICQQMGNSLLELENKYYRLYGKIDYLRRLKLFLEEILNKNKKNAEGAQRISLHMTHRDIAQYLQCSRQSISFNLSKMKQDGVIDYGRNRFQVLNLEKLKNWQPK